MNFDLTYAIGFGGAVIIVLGISAALVVGAALMTVVRSAKQDVDQNHVGPEDGEESI